MSLRLFSEAAEEGAATFFKAPLGDVEELKEGMVAIAGVPYDLAGSTRKGARYGPRNLREASTRYARSLEKSVSIDFATKSRVTTSEGVLQQKVRDIGDTNMYPVDWDKMGPYLRRCMHQVASTGALPIFAGGDHVISHPLVLGFQDTVKARGSGRIGYIQFSSQLDLGDEDPMWGKLWRGSVARRILESGAVRPENLVFVGTNGYIPQTQVTMARDKSLTVYTLGQVEQRGIEVVTKEAIACAGEGCEAIYVSIDADVIDGVYVQSASDIRFQGLSVLELERAMQVLSESKVGALDVVGSNPVFAFASQGRTGSQWAAHLVFRFIAPRLLKISPWY